MTKRQQIVDAIETALKGVTAFGGRVYPWLRVDLPVTSLPALAVYDTTVNHNITAQGFFEHTLEFTVELLVNGKTSMPNVREYMTSVHAEIVTDPTYGGLAADTQLTKSELAMEQAGDIVSAARMTYITRYRTAPNAL